MSQHDKPPKSDSHKVIKSSSFLYEMRYVKYICNILFMCTFILSSGDDYQKTTTSATVGSSYTFSNSSITCLN